MTGYAITQSTAATASRKLLAIALSSTFGSAVRAALEPRLDPGGWQAVVDEARADLRAQLVDGAVPPLTGYAWLVTAKNG